MKLVHGDVQCACPRGSDSHAQAVATFENTQWRKVEQPCNGSKQGARSNPVQFNVVLHIPSSPAKCGTTTSCQARCVSRNCDAQWLSRVTAHHYHHQRCHNLTSSADVSLCVVCHILCCSVIYCGSVSTFGRFCCYLVQVQSLGILVLPSMMSMCIGQELDLGRYCWM